jgi:hypothetical protein
MGVLRQTGGSTERAPTGGATSIRRVVDLKRTMPSYVICTRMVLNSANRRARRCVPISQSQAVPLVIPAVLLWRHGLLDQDDVVLVRLQCEYLLVWCQPPSNTKQVYTAGHASCRPVCLYMVPTRSNPSSVRVSHGLFSPLMYMNWHRLRLQPWDSFRARSDTRPNTTRQDISTRQ